MRAQLITLALSALLPIAAGASNVVTDFSTATPNGSSVWTYGTGTPGTFSAFTTTGTNFGPGYGFSYWSNASNGLAAVGIGAPGAPFGTVNVPAGQLWMHPGSGTAQDSIVEYTAATAGMYNFTSTFYHDDTAGGTNGGTFYPSSTGQIVGVYKNGVLVGADSALLGTGYLDSHSFNGTIALGAGDVLEFDVAKNAAYYNDSTGFVATVGATPEPSSLILMGSGILGLAGAVRRRLSR